MGSVGAPTDLAGFVAVETQRLLKFSLIAGPSLSLLGPRGRLDVAQRVTALLLVVAGLEHHSGLGVARHREELRVGGGGRCKVLLGLQVEGASVMQPGGEQWIR